MKKNGVPGAAPNPRAAEGFQKFTSSQYGFRERCWNQSKSVGAIRPCMFKIRWSARHRRSNQRNEA